jgi:hypothetical protein
LQGPQNFFLSPLSARACAYLSVGAVSRLKHSNHRFFSFFFGRPGKSLCFFVHEKFLRDSHFFRETDARFSRSYRPFSPFSPLYPCPRFGDRFLQTAAESFCAQRLLL